MGNESPKINEQSNGVIIEPVTESGGDRTSGNSSSTTSTRTTDRGSGGSGGNTTRTTETVKGENVPELSLLTDEEKTQYLVADEKEQKRLLRNAKRRQRYADQKSESGQPVKPRKVKGAKKEATPQIDNTQLNLIVASLSSVIASRPNCEHWLLSEAEINSITTPLSKMLAESQAFANMGQYSNQIALCMACVTVFMPRLIITVQKNKEVKKIARTGQRTDTVVTDERVRTAGEKKNSNSGTDRGNVKQSSSNGQNNADNVPFYGVPIC